MHLMIPFASALQPETGRSALLRSLRLPNLARLLARLTPTTRHGSDETTLSMPFERALAHAFGWQGDDGRLPWAAQALAQDDIDPGTHAWALLTPVHWLVGRDQVTLADPQHLHLSAQTSHLLFEAVRPLFETEGWRLEWGGPLRWYAAHESLEQLPCASIDRAIGHPIDQWQPAHPQAGVLRRLQNEAQMVLYQHPCNDERADRGVYTVNSFWFSGCGRAQPTRVPPELVVDTRLRAPLLTQDWAAWSQAWAALDATAVLEALERSRQGGSVTLTLAGDRIAQVFETRPKAWFARIGQSFSPSPVAPVLEAL